MYIHIYICIYMYHFTRSHLQAASASNQQECVQDLPLLSRRSVSWNPIKKGP